MGSIRRSILETKIKELTARFGRLTEKLDKLQSQWDRETRSEEQWRMDYIIAETLSERQRVEAELSERKEELGLIGLDSSGGMPVPPSRPDPPPPPPTITRPIEVFYSYSHAMCNFSG